MSGSEPVPAVPAVPGIVDAGADDPPADAPPSLPPHADTATEQSATAAIAARRRIGRPYPVPRRDHRRGIHS